MGLKRRIKPLFLSKLDNRLYMWLLILCITSIWGFAWVSMKASLQYMGPFTFSALRFGVGSLTLILILFFSNSKRPAKDQLIHLMIVGLLQTTIVFLLVMVSLRFVTAGKSSVLLYSMPMWSSLIAVKWLGEKLSPRKQIGLLIGIIGLMIIVGFDIVFTQDKEQLVGELLITLAAISWAAANIYYRVKLSKLSQLQVSTYQMTFGTIGIIFAAVCLEWGEPLQITTTSIFHILFTGIFASALCFTIWFLILSKIDIITATLPTLLVPIFGLFFSWIMLDEAMSTSIIVGSILIFAGIFITQLSSKIDIKSG